VACARVDVALAYEVVDRFGPCEDAGVDDVARQLNAPRSLTAEQSRIVQAEIRAASFKRNEALMGGLHRETAQ
jgi:hypothetical protein